MTDRRQPDRQAPEVSGRRETDPRLTTTDCAERLGVTTQFIVGEINAGRLRALVLQRGGRRRIYRVSPAALTAYIRQHRWQCPAAHPAAPDSTERAQRTERTDAPNPRVLPPPVLA